MKLRIDPGGALRGEVLTGSEVGIPGDKSLSHRAALFAALAEGESVIQNLLVSGVTEAMLRSLSTVGVVWELNGSRLTIQGNGITGFVPQKSILNCGNSATTMRLLAGAMALAGISVVLDGSGGLRRRPMGRIVDPLRAMGVPITASDANRAPLVLNSRAREIPLKSRVHRLAVASAQVKSCIILASLAADGETKIIEPGPSRDHTERMLSSMGVEISGSQHHDPFSNGKLLYETRVAPSVPLRLSPLQITLPGDISSAAFLIVAALITPDSDVVLRGVGLNPTRTGLLDALMQMGADIQIAGQRLSAGEPVGDLEVKYSSLQAANISGELVVRMIDEFPVFAVAAAYADGVTIVSEADELRTKESDRISVICRNLFGLGVDIQEKPDGFHIRGGNGVTGGAAVAFGDHRLAMSMAVAGLASRHPVVIQGAEIINESFPQFIEVLQVLGAQLSLEE
jgi:3-phosphoshikimate 1-carboxyvinyltransferase